MNIKEIEFDSERMKKFMKQDALLRFVVKDLMRKGHSEEAAMEATFNGYVREDFIMEKLYQAL